MKNWSGSPFDRIVQLADIGSYAEEHVIARDKGEARVIYELAGHPGWLAKLYKPETKVDHGMLGRLIDLPGTMPPADLALVDRGVAWPVARVLDGYRTAGIIMAKATAEFSWDVALLAGRTRRQTIEIDLLAIPADRIRKLGIPVPTSAARLTAVGGIVAVAALFERHGVVYGDWSFANAFWSPRTNATLIIDMDAAGIETRRFVETPNWEDPQARRGMRLTTYTDRYKVALLVARALTGDRTAGPSAAASVARLYPTRTRLSELLRRSLTAPVASERPTLAALYDAIENPGQPSAKPGSGANVSGMIPWNPGSRQRSGPISRPAAKPAPTRPAAKPPAARPAPRPAARPQSPPAQSPSAPRSRPAPSPTATYSPVLDRLSAVPGWVSMTAVAVAFLALVLILSFV